MLFNILQITRSISQEEIDKTLKKYYFEYRLHTKISHDRQEAQARVYKLDENSLGYYLAGLLEGDGSISLPSNG